MSDLTSQTPEEIDTQLAAVYDDIEKIQREYSKVEGWIVEYESGLERSKAGVLTYSSYTDAGLRDLQLRLDAAKAAYDAAVERTYPFEDEFTRRGGWTRAFLVLNSNGHVHSSRHCTTCYPTTQYGWLPQYSGHDEAEIVADAGRDACSTCFPTAPTDGPASKVELPAKRAARLAREAKAAAKAEKEKITGIWNPDGTELREVPWSRTHSGQPIKSERTAETKAVTIIVSKLWHEEFHPGEDYPWVAPHLKANPDHIDDHDQQTLDRIVTALAAKRGKTEEQVLAQLTAIGTVKYKRQRRA